MSGLPGLERQVRRDLELIDYPAKPWVPPRGDGVLDVLIVGGGQGGLATAFGLMREKIGNILVVDRNPAGVEGPWVTFARMVTLRTPKHVTGPDLGVPSLTPRAWYEARFGSEAWAALDKIPRELWQEYLVWYRAVLGLPVRNDAEVTAIAPDGDLVAATLASGEILRARKIVLATGIEGSGRWHVPGFIRDAIPRDRWAHTSEAIDFPGLAGRRIGVLGAGASAFDNAATALEAGAASLDLCLRRPDLPRINPYRWMEQPGFLGHFAEMPDLDKWRFTRHIFDLNQPPPQDTFWRCARHPGFACHAGTPWTGAAMEGGEIRIDTPKGPFHFDFLIVGTGFAIDLSLRPELAAFAPEIALWRDRFAPPTGEESALLASHPYLGPSFEFTERRPGAAPFLRHLHNFTFGATPSMGLSGASISGMKYGVRRLVDGLARALYLEDRAVHYASLRAYDTPELTSTEWPASPPIS